MKEKYQTTRKLAEQKVYEIRLNWLVFMHTLSRQSRLRAIQYINGRKYQRKLILI